MWCSDQCVGHWHWRLWVQTMRTASIVYYKLWVSALMLGISTLQIRQTLWHFTFIFEGMRKSHSWICLHNYIHVSFRFCCSLRYKVMLTISIGMIQTQYRRAPNASERQRPILCNATNAKIGEFLRFKSRGGNTKILSLWETGIRYFLMVSEWSWIELKVPKN